MSRAVFAALAAAALLPVAASAQYGTVQDGPAWGERVRVTPFAGVAPRLTRSESWRIVIDGLPLSGDMDVDLGAGPAGGAEVEVRMWDRFSLIGSALLVARGEAVEMDPVTGEFYSRAGSDFLVGKIGVAMRLREQVSDLQLRTVTATAFAAPALIREMPAEDTRAGVTSEATNMLGANLGVNAEIPFAGSRFAVQIGLEDFLVFWNEDALARRTDAAFAQAGYAAQSTVDAGFSHMPLLRAGVSLRLR
jgi:hypothetical protein